MSKYSPICAGCGKTPTEIGEYKDFVLCGEYKTEDQACICEEGTYDRKTNNFLCTRCYIMAGMPLMKRR